MSEVIRDSAIKLFGQIIYLPQCPYTSFATSTSQDSKAESRDGSISPREEKSTETTSSSDITEDPNSPKKDDQSSDASQEKTTLKKPDKIIPCPRCNSMETKFCYYNNYNVNQPRHFCKNCQRYWTSGGTMRSMPVGSGRRKNKSALLRTYPHIMVQDAMQTNGLLISPLGFPANLYPAALYWGSAAPCVNTASPASSAHSSSVLGKHSRGGEVIRPSNLLRIHDGSCIKKEVFKGFELKGDGQW